MLLSPASISQLFLASLVIIHGFNKEILKSVVAQSSSSTSSSSTASSNTASSSTSSRKTSSKSGSDSSSRSDYGTKGSTDESKSSRNVKKSKSRSKSPSLSTNLSRSTLKTDEIDKQILPIENEATPIYNMPPPAESEGRKRKTFAKVTAAVLLLGLGATFTGGAYVIHRNKMIREVANNARRVGPLNYNALTCPSLTPTDNLNDSNVIFEYSDVDIFSKSEAELNKGIESHIQQLMLNPPIITKLFKEYEKKVKVYMRHITFAIDAAVRQYRESLYDNGNSGEEIVTYILKELQNLDMNRINKYFEQMDWLIPLVKSAAKDKLFTVKDIHVVRQLVDPKLSDSENRTKLDSNLAAKIGKVEPLMNQGLNNYVINQKKVKFDIQQANQLLLYIGEVAMAYVIEDADRQRKIINIVNENEKKGNKKKDNKEATTNMMTKLHGAGIRQILIDVNNTLFTEKMSPTGIETEEVENMAKKYTGEIKELMQSAAKAGIKISFITNCEKATKVDNKEMLNGKEAIQLMVKKLDITEPYTVTAYQEKPDKEKIKKDGTPKCENSVKVAIAVQNFNKEQTVFIGSDAEDFSDVIIAGIPALLNQGKEYTFKNICSTTIKAPQNKTFRSYLIAKRSI